MYPHPGFHSAETAKSRASVPYLFLFPTACSIGSTCRGTVKKTIQNLRAKVRKYKHAALECWKNLKDKIMFDDELLCLTKIVLNQRNRDCEWIGTCAKILVGQSLWGFSLLMEDYWNTI